MAQYDLLLTQNISAAGVEFSEKYVNIGKGGLLSAIATTLVPTVLAGGTNGYRLVRDDNEVTGLKWVVDNNHVQGTDTGTTAASFKLDSDGYKIDLVSESASKLGIKVDGDATYADLQAKDGTFFKVTVGSAAPTGAYELTHKTYVDGLLAAHDAMVYKGTVGAGGTIEKAALEALTTYNAGWTYRVITAGTYFSVVCEIGDLITAIVDRAGGGDVDTDWTFIQTNLDGAVIGPASVTADHIAQFSGTTGKLIKDGGVLGTMAAAAAADYILKSVLTEQGDIIYASAASTPAALPHGVLGQVLQSGGNAANPSWGTLGGLLWVAAPATKTTAGVAGSIAKDANFFYVCTATDVWARSAIAKNW